ILNVVEFGAGRLFGDSHAIDLVLEPHQAVEQSFRAGRATWDIDVHGYDVIDALENGGCVEGASHVGTCAHGDYPLLIRHLVIDATDDWSHLQSYCSCNDHQVGLARTRAEDSGAEAVHVETRCARRHHFDRAARQTERHRPKGRLTRPVEHEIDGRCDDIFFKSVFNP